MDISRLKDLAGLTEDMNNVYVYLENEGRALHGRDDYDALFHKDLVKTFPDKSRIGNRTVELTIPRDAIVQATEAGDYKDGWLRNASNYVSDVSVSRWFANHGAAEYEVHGPIFDKLQDKITVRS